MHEETKRLFVGLQIPNAVRHSINKYLRVYHRLLPYPIKLTEPKKYHITLDFLGNVPVNMLPSLKESLQALDEIKQFEIKLTTPHLFPEKRPRVLALMIEASLALQNLVQTTWALTSNYHPSPRKHTQFRGHVTVARIKSATAHKQPLLPLFESPITVNEVLLFESILKPSGAIYHVLHSTVLR